MYFENYNGETITLIILTHLGLYYAVDAMSAFAQVPVLGIVPNLLIVILVDTIITNLDGYV